MKLVLDQGNTSLKAGFFDKNVLVQLMHNPKASELISLSKEYRIDQCLISVVGNFSSILQESLNSSGIKIHQLSIETALPFKVEYQKDSWPGADRIALAAASLAEFGKEATVLTIDLGTCATYDLMEKGSFKGGIISPGLNSRLRAMKEHTASLPEIQFRTTKTITGTSTEECMLSGAYYGLANEINGFIEHYSSSIKDLKVVMSGGDAPKFESHLKHPIFAASNWVLRGLSFISEFNAY